MNPLISNTCVEISKNKKQTINIHKPNSVCKSLIKRILNIWRGTKRKSLLQGNYVKVQTWQLQ